MKQKQNDYVFIDSQNLNLGVQDVGWKLDFRRFYVYLKDKYKIRKAFLFIGYVAGNEVLYTFLQQIGYIVIFKPTLEYNKKGEKYIKGNVDAELVLHCMIEYANFSKAIIISGDGDFYCLIEYLDSKNKLYKIGIPNSNKYSALLRRFRKYFFFIDSLKNKLNKKERE